MDQPQSLCKITGTPVVEKLKERLWRIHLNVECLQRALQALQRMWNEFQKSEDLRDIMLLESLTFYAVVEYTKCFNSEFSDKLVPTIFSDLLRENAGPADLSEREFHHLIMNYRNMHLVHSDNLLKISDTGGMKYPNGDFAVGPVIAIRSYREDEAFYGALNLISQKALDETVRRLQSAQQRLMEAINSGEGTITDEPIKLMPISDTQAPRQMWGIGPRTAKL